MIEVKHLVKTKLADLANERTALNGCSFIINNLKYTLSLKRHISNKTLIFKLINT